MPADRTLAADVAETLTEMYAAAQQEVAENVGRRLRTGLARPRPGLDYDKLAALGALRHANHAVLAKLAGDTTGQVQQTLALAFRRGGDSAVAELAKARGWGPGVAAELKRVGINADALTTLAFALRSTLLGTHLRVLRWSLDAYREVVAHAAAAGPGLLGTKTRLQVAQDAWSRLLGQGITGFVDKAGRRWELASYVEMATRTTITHAVVQAHSDQLDALGVDLRVVSDAPQECKLCRPWEGRVLAASGPTGRRTVQAESAVSAGTVTVHVAGTVDEAIAAGLLHPNCRHTINAYLPGATRVPTNTADPEGDRARQQLRALERKVRTAKLQQAAALDPEAAKAAAAQVRALQAQIRDHIATAPTTLFRQPTREQVGRAR